MILLLFRAFVFLTLSQSKANADPIDLRRAMTFPGVIFVVAGISNLTFLVDFPNNIYFYTLGSYVRHQKSSISENPSKSTVREYYQMKYIAYADMVVYEKLK